LAFIWQKTFKEKAPNSQNVSWQFSAIGVKRKCRWKSFKPSKTDAKFLIQQTMPEGENL